MKRFAAWVLALLLTGSVCTAASALVSGVYRDKAPGFGGEVIVKAVVREGKLTEITTENTGGEKSEYYLKAEEGLIPVLLEKQEVEGVDVVAGATGTSESILAAMRGVLEQARYTGEGNGGEEQKEGVS